MALRKRYCSCGSGRELGFCGHGRTTRKPAATRAKVLRNGRVVEKSTVPWWKRGATERKALRNSGYGGVRSM
jgi:hypothetical protein